MDNKLVLVTGATGYIGGRLIVRLLERGYRVRALARDPQLLMAHVWFDQIEIAIGNTFEPYTLLSALEGVHTAYYLIHNMSNGAHYTDAEIESARNFISAAELCKVRHIIYLGGLANPKNIASRHMASRIQTGAALRSGKVPVTEFRAGVIVGSGSTSFEAIRYITEWQPVIVGPPWLKNSVQPIAIQNVLEYLIAAFEKPPEKNAVYEIGGPDVMPYGHTMLRYGRLRGLRRTLLLLPWVPVGILAWLMSWMTPVPPRYTRPLIGGLAGDSVVIRDRARHAFPDVKLLGFEEAVSKSLADLHPASVERIWNASEEEVNILKHEGFFVDHRRIRVKAMPEEVFAVISKLGGISGWPYANWLWKLRGHIDKLLGGPGSRVSINTMKVGDALDYYRIEAVEQNRLLRLYSELKAPGEGWMEWRIDPDGNTTLLTQTGFFAPHGLPGFLYWYLLNPFHRFVFHGLIHEIAYRSEA